jgi:hypothetical protein
VALYVDSKAVAAFNADTSGFKVDEVRLGPSRGVEDAMGMATGANGSMYFDEFMSFGSTSALVNPIYLPLMQFSY